MGPNRNKESVYGNLSLGKSVYNDVWSIQSYAEHDKTHKGIVIRSYEGSTALNISMNNFTQHDFKLLAQMFTDIAEGK
jgi:hypothetical protein